MLAPAGSMLLQHTSRCSRPATARSARRLDGRAEPLVQQAGGEVGGPQEVALGVGHDGVQGGQREEVRKDERATVLEAAARHELVGVLGRHLGTFSGQKKQPSRVPSARRCA